MFSRKIHQQLLGSLLALVAIILSACTSSVTSTAQSASVATATVAVAITPVGVGSAGAGTTTPVASAYATGLFATPTPTPPLRAVPTNAPDPNTFQGTDCGRIEMVGKGLVDDPRNAPALDCFWQAYQQCPTMGKAQLFVYQRFFETSNNRFFRLDGTAGSCVITEELQAFGLMANTPTTSAFICTGLTRDSGGLYFLGCGSDGDFTIPATPIGAATVAPSAVGVPTVRTVTLADDGGTITLPTGTSFLLALGGDFDWQVQIADTAIVSPYPHAVIPPDAQGIFTATQQGQTTLTATGNPKCASATPRCLAPSQSFHVQIVAA
ncbi:MAG: hypothetical protein M3Y58_17945 [Chloroflexota bacterium]|nr:hypothetical protein [Chloroflexota bacterium]